MKTIQKCNFIFLAYLSTPSQPKSAWRGRMFHLPSPKYSAKLNRAKSESNGIAIMFA